MSVIRRFKSTPAPASPRAPSQPDTWRPMAFGHHKPDHVRNALCEPLWDGWRSIVRIGPGGATIRDEDADEFEGFDALREALAAASLANDLVVDGYLVPAPLESQRAAGAATGIEASITVAQITRQLFLGGGGRNARKEALEQSAARQVRLTPDGPTAFMAIDLLWLDGESLLDLPLLERRRLLESTLAESELVRRSVIVRPPVEPWFAQWKAFGIGDYAVKDANSRYVPGGESPDWVAAAIPRR